MNKRVIFLLLILSLFIGGCLTGQQLSAQLSTFHGKPEGEVIRYLGPPTNVYESGGAKYLTFSASRNVTLTTPSTYQTTVIGDTIYTNQTGGGIHNIDCGWSVTFTTYNGIITSHQWRDMPTCGANSLSRRLPQVSTNRSSTGSQFSPNCEKVCSEYTNPLEQEKCIKFCGVCEERNAGPHESTTFKEAFNTCMTFCCNL